MTMTMTITTTTLRAYTPHGTAAGIDCSMVAL
jgi:hypothetical protein